MTLTFCLVLLTEFSVAKDETQIQVGVLFIFYPVFCFVFHCARWMWPLLFSTPFSEDVSLLGGPMVTSKNFSGYTAKCG